jgi:8-oxo-dGTP pyrophosphatase MutT (NUDIX family)
MFCRRAQRGVELLLLRKQDKKGNPLLEDPGGKSNADDESIEVCAAREAAEELNAKVQDPARAKSPEFAALTYQERVDASRDYILELIRRRPLCLVNVRTKYALFVVQLPDLGELDFGQHEIHSKYDIPREACWFTAPEVFAQPSRSIHPRIRHILRHL